MNAPNPLPAPPILFENIPSFLKALPQWVMWRNVKKADGKPTKIPYDARTGKPASTTDPTTWATFDEAVRAYGDGNNYTGIGIVFCEEGPLAGIDLDDVIDGSGIMASWARTLIEQFDTYTEISPSGTGAKLFFLARKPINSGAIWDLPDGASIEVYDSKRYFTLTGQAMPGRPTEPQNRQAELDALWETTRQPKGAPDAYETAERAAIQGEAAPIEEGKRNTLMTRMAGKLRHAGLVHMELLAALRSYNQRCCNPPLPDDELITIAQNIGKKPDTAPAKSQGSLRVRCLKDIEPTAIRWLWPARIPLGKYTLLAGDPGLGKSLLSIDMIARVTTGRLWPDGAQPAPVGSVVLLTAEDDLADTIRPRLDAAEADCNKVHVIESAVDVDPATQTVIERCFSLEQDLARLEGLVKKLGDVVLAVIDPVSAYLGSIDSHKDAEIRALLLPLRNFAEGNHVTPLGILHLNKSLGLSALHRIAGSMAFAAAARAVWIVARDDENPERRLFLPAKSNLARDEGGLSFTVESHPSLHAPVICWGELINANADTAFTGTEGPRDADLPEAAIWLRSELQAGPRQTLELKEAGAKVGFKIETLRRGKTKLGARAFKETFSGRWMWQLPKGPRVQEPAHEH